ncbi:MAG TPA: N-acetylmuramoyl-L-alanine amidase [Acidimicrobiales bacterium]|nr:N-acetylmuramoyl-L-alanine amidase [Acidimicrobiales bacterium]
MVKRFSGALAVTLALLVLPVPSGIGSRAVAAVQNLSVTAGDAATHQVEPFDLIGLSWPATAKHAHGRLRVRVDGAWSEWMDVEGNRDEGPDLASRESGRARAFSSPVWVGGADAYQLVTETAAQAHVVRDRKSKALPLAVAGLGASPAGALVARPEIHTRGEWVAREPKVAPTYGAVKVGFVHHTVGANEYTAAEVPGIIRSIQAYHMDANGWDDIGYNFLVDRFGRVWEGRGGGIEHSVIGAHAGGFNTNSTGVAVLGTFTDVAAPVAATAAVSRLLSWKLPFHGSDPASQSAIQSKGSTRYAEGQVVTLPNVSGHRDVSQTSCPGNRLYERVGQIRADAAAGAAVAVPYSEAWRGGVFVATGDLDDDNVDEIVTGADSGGGPHVRTFEPGGEARKSFIVYPQGFRGGVRVAVGNTDGLGADELITAAGPGGGPHVRVLKNETEGVTSFMAYTPGFTGGVYVASGNVDGLPGDEIITGAGAGGGPHVRVFKGDGTPLTGFMAYGSAFTGGVRVATADVNGDGRDEIVTGAGPGGGPHVRILDMTGRALGSFFAYPQDFTGGVNVAGIASDQASSTPSEWIVTGAGESGGPHVRVFDVTGAEKGNFFAGRPTDKGGVRVAGGVFTPRANPDAAPDEERPRPQPAIVTAPGPNVPGLLKLVLPTGTLVFP